MSMAGVLLDSDEANMKRKSCSMQGSEQLGTHSPSLMEPSQICKTIWCGSMDDNPDVTICLKAVDPETSGIVAELKLHSDRLKECSKYFEAALSERWASSQTPIMTFTLEMVYGVEVEHYADCFTRMYTPGHKDFKDIKFALGLLRVASQIQYAELVSSICRYLVMVNCSVEDELRIRQYSTSASFPCNLATDLTARLEAEGECEKKQLDLIEWTISKAWNEDRPTSRGLDVEDARSICANMLLSIGDSELNVTFQREMVKIVNKEVKKLVVQFHHDFLPRFIPRLKPPVPRLSPFMTNVVEFHADSLPQFIPHQNPPVHLFPVVTMTPEFKSKLAAICWILEMMLKAKVADELVECVLNLEMLSTILQYSLRFDDCWASISEFARLLMLVHHEAVAGNLWLGTAEKVHLLVRWYSFYDDIIVDHSDAFVRSLEMKEGKSVTPAELKTELEQMRERVYLTLPIDQQTEFVMLKFI